METLLSVLHIKGHISEEITTQLVHFALKSWEINGADIISMSTILDLFEALASRPECFNVLRGISVPLIMEVVKQHTVVETILAVIIITKTVSSLHWKYSH